MVPEILHNYLGSWNGFSPWLDRMIAFRFVDRVDYSSVQKSTVVLGLFIV